MVLGNRFVFDWLILRRLVLETNHTQNYFFKCHLCSMYNLKRKALLRAKIHKNIHRDWMQAGNDAWPANAFIRPSIRGKRMLLASIAASLLSFCNNISWLGSEVLDVSVACATGGRTIGKTHWVLLQPHRCSLNCERSLCCFAFQVCWESSCPVTDKISTAF